MSYFDNTQYVSNSELKKMRDCINGIERPPYLAGVFAFGNLCDALITEPNLVDLHARTVIDSSGEPLSFSMEEMRQAQEMRTTALSDPIMQLIVRNMQFQYELYLDDFPICPDENPELTLPIRLKMDGFNPLPRINTGMDLKTTACTTQKQFIESIYHFDYDQQGAWYMDGSGVDRFWFLGVGKKRVAGKYPLFKHAFQRGDEMHRGGQEKYRRLAKQYHMLISSLNPMLVYA